MARYLTRRSHRLGIWSSTTLGEITTTRSRRVAFGPTNSKSLLRLEHTCTKSIFSFPSNNTETRRLLHVEHQSRVCKMKFHFARRRESTRTRIPNSLLRLLLLVDVLFFFFRQTTPRWHFIHDWFADFDLSFFSYNYSSGSCERTRVSIPQACYMKGHIVGIRMVVVGFGGHSFVFFGFSDSVLFPFPFPYKLTKMAIRIRFLTAERLKGNR